MPPETGLLWIRHAAPRSAPELTGEFGRARLVVLACETGGRWLEEAHDFFATPRPCQSKVETTGDPRSGATLLEQTLGGIPFFLRPRRG